MSENDTFLQAICKDPDDDFPRLVYADWLEERGDPQAEFIRLQCEIYRKRLSSEHIPQTLEERAGELFFENASVWLRELSPMVQSVQDFDRGFLKHIKVTGTQFRQYAGELERHPITSLEITHARENFAENIRHPFISRIQKLLLAKGQLGVAEAYQLADSPRVSGLRDLDLNANSIDNDGFIAMLRSPHLGKLKKMSICYNNLTSESLFALAQSEFHKHLTYFGACNNEHSLSWFNGRRYLREAVQSTTQLHWD